MPKTKEMLEEFLLKKGLEPTLFNNKIEFAAPIQAHAAWVFTHIYSKYYIKSSLATSKKIARLYHGMSHICRAAIYAPVWLNLFRMYGFQSANKLTDTDLKLIQIALLFHDAARENDGKDEWDHESAELLYYYLKMLKFSDEISIKFAEAVANKDSESNGFYLEFQRKFSGIIWEKVGPKPLNIFQIIIHDSDCLDILRARDHFDATQLFFYKLIYLEEKAIAANDAAPSLEHLAKLITEARSIIRKHGDYRGTLQPKVKKKFEHENGYVDILKTIDDLNYCMLPKLYNEALLLPTSELKTAIQLPKESFKPEKGLEESNIQAAMREGAIFARGITPIPAAVHNKPKQAPEGLFRKRTFAEIELDKTARRQEKKIGNPLRSVCMLFPGASVFCATGFLIVNPETKAISSMSIIDADTGWYKKEKFFFSKYSKNDPSIVERQKQLLIHQLKLGGSSKRYGSSQFPATYTEITYDVTQYDAVYFTKDPVRANEFYANDPEPIHEFSPILQAIYLQQLYEQKHHKQIPIIEYSGIHNFIKILPEEAYTEEKIESMWVRMCCDYVTSLKKLQAVVDFVKAPLEAIKIAATYGAFPNKLRFSEEYSSPDRLYHAAFKERIHQAISKAITELIPTLKPRLLENILVARGDFVRYLNLHKIKTLTEKNNLRFEWPDDNRSLLHSSLFIAGMSGSIVFLYFFLMNFPTLHIDHKELIDHTVCYTALNGHLDAVRLLHEFGAQINAFNKEGFTALYAAVQEGHLAVVEYLLRSGANPNTANCEGFTSLHALFVKKDVTAQAPKILRMLLDSSADINVFTKKGYLPFHLAILHLMNEETMEQVVDMLMTEGMNINQKMDFKVKSFKKYWNCIPKYFWPSILKTTDDKQIISGMSFLHFAILNNNQAAVKVLLSRGARTTDHFLGLDSMTIAEGLKRDKIVELLKKKSTLTEPEVERPISLAFYK